MKKMIVLMAALVMLVGLSGMAMASDFKGEVTKVDGKMVTIKITKGKASQLDVGSKVEIEAEESDGAPKKSGGMDMLMGC